MGAGIKRICVFAGASEGSLLDYRRAAVSLGEELASRRIDLVYGGAGIGLMGAVANAVLAASGTAIGVLPKFLRDREVDHPNLSALHLVDSLHDRVSLMSRLSDAFVALPGGLGTFEELFQMATWSMLGLHRKPCGVVDVDSYFDPMYALLDRAVESSFLEDVFRDAILVDQEPGRLLDRLVRWQPPEPRFGDLATRNR